MKETSEIPLLGKKQTRRGSKNLNAKKIVTILEIFHSKLLRKSRS